MKKIAKQKNKFDLYKILIKIIVAIYTILLRHKKNAKKYKL